MEWLVVAAIIGGFVWWRISKMQERSLHQAKNKATDTASEEAAAAAKAAAAKAAEIDAPPGTVVDPGAGNFDKSSGEGTDAF